MRNKIAITGATGFAGRHAVAELLRRGHSLAALVRDPKRAGLPSGVDIVVGHLEDADALARLVRGADAVIHLGAVLAARPRDYFRYNSFATRALAEIAVKADVKRFVFASSLAAREDALSHYGASKFAAEQSLRHLINGSLNTIILRAPAIYGPGDRATLPLIQQLTGRVAVIPGKREQRFSLLYVKDFARLIADAVDGGMTGLYEVSDGRPGGYRWVDLIKVAQATEGKMIRAVYVPKPVAAGVALFANVLAQVTGKAGTINPGKVRELYHDDWVAHGQQLTPIDAVDFSRGFPETLAWYRASGWLPPRGDTTRSSVSLNREAGQ
ncbi:MAG TPA: NAD-dependent epimerase/dehydratase family protein [Aestuariivirga sp.]|nr:NAD-dependent epimerase/dehydratase family protein [Aestuariivirga sp.]